MPILFPRKTYLYKTSKKWFNVLHGGLFERNHSTNEFSHLQNYIHEEIAKQLPAYLDDFNEDVRYATIEALAAQKDPSTREALIQQMSKEASNRAPTSPKQRI